MPRTSQRRQALKDLELMWMISKIDENHQRIAKYLGLPTLPTLGSAMYPQDQDQSTLINQHVCQSNITCEQLSIAHQLALTLECLGSNENAASVGKFERNFQVGRGTVILVTRQVIKAIDSLEHNYIKWPNTQQRRQISQVMRQEGFDGCVGFIDGTNFPLYGKPAWQGEVDFDQQKNFLINAQILCDCDKNIIAFITGWPGQYLLADSAYPLTDDLIPSIKSPMADFPFNSDFNYCLSNSCVHNEHTIDILKGQWASLKKMWLQLNGEQDIIAYVTWIKACCILQNMLSQINDSWEALSNEYKDLANVQVPQDMPCHSTQEQQRAVKEACVEFKYAWGILPIP
ncbi:hypothetical protein O181_050977 [Austropuccinia psidii MF-1]|uniref:DDE Tnp4 domain-containing protein n=1 Tax=Austropuccinia psidii MF-1 TaxID=1389203 RepID=A0A9Q3E4S2_9BASI|nr:hypothetical protein [Austropuccinia psidii MF-1]